MITIHGLDSNCRDKIDDFIRDQREISCGTYDVDLFENVKLSYSYGDIVLHDGEEFVTLEQMQYEDVSII